MARVAPPPERLDVAVTDWTPLEASEFMARGWPPHDRGIQIHWSSEDVVLVGKLGERPLGVARGVIIGGLGELKQLLVTKAEARLGVGSRLLREFERRCRARGCHKLRLETADYQARPFYERHGFVVEGTLTNDRFGRDWFVMAKRLELG